MVDYVVIDNDPTPIENISRSSSPIISPRATNIPATACIRDTAEEKDVARSLRRRNHLHAGRHRLFVVAASSRPSRPTIADREADGAAGGGRPRLRRSAPRARPVRGHPGPRGRRHDRRQLYPLRADRRHDQDADHERALRQAAWISSAAPASSPSICARPAPRSRSRPCSATTRWRNSCSKDLTAAGVNCMPIIDRDPADDAQERHRRRRLPPAQDRHARQPLDLRAHPADACASRSAKRGADIVVFSDFRHGIFNRDTIPALTEAIPAGAFRVADSQVASRWGNILEFRVSI